MSKLDEIRQQMDRDPWYIKAIRNVRVWFWFLRDDVNYYFEKIFGDK